MICTSLLQRSSPLLCTEQHCIGNRLPGIENWWGRARRLSDSEINSSKQVGESTEKNSFGASLHGHAEVHFRWDRVKYYWIAVCPSKGSLKNVLTNWIQLWRGDKYSQIWAGQAMNREVQSIYIQQNENMNTHSVLKQTLKVMNEIVETRNNIWRIYYRI